MEITIAGTEAVVSPEDTRPEQATITIALDSETDDPHGHLWGLLLADRLEDFLRVYTQGQNVTVEDDGDLWGLLVATGRVGGRLDKVRGELMWVARDTHGRSWGEISRGLEMPRKTARNIVERVRESYAASGYWRDASGLHYERDPEAAKALAWARAAELAGQRARGGDGDEVIETMRAFGVELDDSKDN